MTDKTSGVGTTPTGLPPIAENLFGAEVYADAAAFFAIKNGNICVTFTSLRYDNSTQPATMKNVIIGRLTMPVIGAHGLSVSLWDYLKQNNFIPEKSGTAN